VALMTTRRSPLLIFLVGLAAIYLGERSLAHAARLAADGLGALLLLVAIGVAIARLAAVWARPSDEDRRAAAKVLGAYALCLLAVGLYAAALWLPAEGSHLRPVLLVIWPFVLLLGLAPAVAIELALGAMAAAPVLELWRVRLAARSAQVIVAGIIVFAGANYAASQWNRKIDLSYFHSARPGEATLAIAREVGEPLRLLCFFPTGNDVLEQVRPYVESLAQVNPRIHVEVVDQALEPALAREFKVRTNGAIVLARGEQRESLSLGLELEAARTNLRRLDAELQRRLIKVTRPPRLVYFTTGHMERDYQPSAADTRLGLSDLKSMFESLGYTVKRLGLGEGLSAEVPSDATMVVVAGPLEPFLPAERAAVHKYLEGGGHLLALIDPDTGVTEDELLAPLGVKVSRKLVASEEAQVRIDGRADSPYNFATGRTTPHDSTSTLNQFAGRMPVIVLGAGSLSKLASAPATLKIVYTLSSLPGSWEDTNANGRFDADGEKRGARELAAAIEKTGEATKDAATNKAAPGMRALVITDADLAGNRVVLTAGNAYLLMDGIKWLGGDEALAGKVESEEDVPFVYNKDNDAVWFYGTSFIVPAAVLAIGLLVVRRGRASKSS
jgi:hypothetical protein